MSRFDNMGGFISADFALKEDVNFLAVFGNNCSISLKNNRNWKPFDAKREGISVSITSEKGDSGLIFKIEGTIIIKKESPFLSILRLNPQVLIKYKTANNLTRIIGTPEYPLSTVFNHLTPSKASGFYGYELSFSGKQLIEPPILNI